MLLSLLWLSHLLWPVEKWARQQDLGFYRPSSGISPIDQIFSPSPDTWRARGWSTARRPIYDGDLFALFMRSRARQAKHLVMLVASTSGGSRVLGYRPAWWGPFYLFHQARVLRDWADLSAGQQGLPNIWPADDWSVRICRPLNTRDFMGLLMPFPWSVAGSAFCSIAGMKAGKQAQVPYVPRIFFQTYSRPIACQGGRFYIATIRSLQAYDPTFKAIVDASQDWLRNIHVIFAAPICALMALMTQGTFLGSIGTSLRPHDMVSSGHTTELSRSYTFYLF